MGITEEELAEIVKEEIENMLGEAWSGKGNPFTKPSGKKQTPQKDPWANVGKANPFVDPDEYKKKLATDRQKQKDDASVARAVPYSKSAQKLRADKPIALEGDVEEGLTKSQSEKEWEKMNQAANPERGKDLVSKADLAKIYRDQQRAIKKAQRKKKMKENFEETLEEGKCPPGHFWKSFGGQGGTCVKDPDYKGPKSAYSQGATVSPPKGSWTPKYEE
jgi:hypothetical protein